MKINGKSDFLYRNNVSERWKDVNSDRKDASIFHSCIWFARRIMKINGKNDFLYRNNVLERWKDVNSDRKDASIFHSCI